MAYTQVGVCGDTPLRWFFKASPNPSFDDGSLCTISAQYGFWSAPVPAATFDHIPQGAILGSDVHEIAVVGTL